MTRIPPQAVEAEQAVLGGLMLDPNALAKITLAEADFYRHDHQRIFRAIVALDEAGKPYDAVTLGEGLPKEDANYLVEIARGTPSAANIATYAAIVRDKAVLRQLIEVGTCIVNDGFEPDGRSTPELLDDAMGALLSVQGQQANSECDLRSALKLAFADMSEAHAAGDALRGVPSGFSDLDRRLGGFHAGDLVFIGARPKMGKTAMLVNMAYNAMRAEVPCGIISGEQSSMQLAQRFLALETSIAGERMRNGQIEEEEWAKISASVSRLAASRVRIYDAGGPTITQVRRIARKWHREHGIKALYVDYLQRLRGRAKDRAEEVGEIARGLKDIARELNIPVIALAQVKREVETRNDKRPLASDIANSDEATREADQILMLYRDEVYNDQSPHQGIAELNLEANRHGPTGMFKLAWQADAMRFRSLSRDGFA